MASYGEGSLIPIKDKPGLFYASFPLGKGKRSPKFRCKNIREGKRLFEQWQSEEARKAEKAAIEAERGSKEQRTVGYYLETHWNSVKGNYAETSRALHESTREVHILKDAAFLALDYFELSSADVQSFLNRLNASDATKRRVYKYLRSAFQPLVEERVLPTNPIHIARTKLPKSKDSEVVAFTPEDESKLLAFSMKDELFWFPLVVLAFDSGCRMSELLGLKWDKVDLERGEVHIHRTLNTVKKDIILKEATKTDSSRRTIQIGKTTIRALNALRGEGMVQDAYVFSDGGEPLSYHTFRHRWEKFLKAAGVRHYGFHSTRHTCATRLLRGGAFLTAVAARLGHSKPSLTLDLYSDAIPSDQHALASAFDSMVSAVLNRPNLSLNVQANLSQNLSQEVAA